MNQNNRLIQAIAAVADQTPNKLAITSSNLSISYSEILPLVSRLQTLVGDDSPVCGIYFQNSPVWAMIDLWMISHNKTIVPLPVFFSESQLAHCIADASVGFVITDNPAMIIKVAPVKSATSFEFLGVNLFVIKIDCTEQDFPTECFKITYTSGTTGAPKGVKLNINDIIRVSDSLKDATEASQFERHLSVLPLSTLLENIAAIYIPLLAGATTVIQAPSDVGFSGSSGFDIHKLSQSINNFEITSLVTTPEILNGITLFSEETGNRFPSLRFVAVGGAPVSSSLLEKAESQGIPVFEGYGLSECSSVVSLNTREHRKIGSVGRLLPHLQVKFDIDGEILIKGTLLHSYTNGSLNLTSDGFFPSGDLGYLDNEGFLYIKGRKKNQFITSFGRNVSPEWVESELNSMPSIKQSAVFGEGRPFNVAVIVPRKNYTEHKLAKEIAEVNSRLPDYARVHKWRVDPDPFTVSNNQLTPNGRLKRTGIWAYYAEILESLYKD